MRKRLKKHYRFGFNLFLFLLLFVASVLMYSRYYSFTQDSPYDLIISDISSSSAVITWKSKGEVSTYVLLNNEKLVGTGIKERFHRVEIKGLEENTPYSFSISDGKREWDRSIFESSEKISKFVSDEFVLKTKEDTDLISLPRESYLKVLPNELVYAVLYSMETGEYSQLQSEYANRYGGVVFDKESFGVENPDSYSLERVKYFDISASTKALISKIFASEINCNQNIPSMSSNAISREAYTDLATRWVSGRGKNYAYECYNDTVYRAKVAGVDPAFALTIWINESGASNYTFNPSLTGLIEDFGIHGLSSVPVQDYNAQINHFLKLSHKYTCEGLSAWEAWGNYYKWGSCNENDPVKREDGINYYKGIEMVYGWVTNGSKLPSVVTGLPKIPPLEEEENEEELDREICCAIKLDNRESLKGDFENVTFGESCSELWKTGRYVFDGKVEYAVEMPNRKDRVSCEIDYEGVCCKLNNGLKWYPKSICTDIIEGITDSKSCNTYTGDMSCFLRDGKYQWLPSIIGSDKVSTVSSEAACIAMNESYSINFNLKKGYNFIGLDLLPVYMGRDMMASDILKEYSDISLIARFEGNEWKDIVTRAEGIPFAGKDFKLEQNSGYLITTSKDVEISLGGWQNPSAEYITNTGGWSLVGGFLYTQSYKASTLISDLKAKSINVDTVAIWSNESGLFLYRVEDDMDSYGEDFNLIQNSALFIKGKI